MPRIMVVDDDAAMREEFIEGNRIEIRGFGVLEVRETKAKPAAKKPRTGEVVYVPSMRKTYFKSGKDLKEALQKPLEQDADEEKYDSPQRGYGILTVISLFLDMEPLVMVKNQLCTEETISCAKYKNSKVLPGANLSTEPCLDFQAILFLRKE